MKRSIVFTLIACAFFTSAGCRRSSSDAQTEIDLSTDAGVLQAYHQITGSTLRPSVFRPEGLGGIIMLNAVIPDDGTEQLGVFVGQTFYRPPEDIAPVLRHLGWQTASPEERVEILRRWLDRSHRLGSVVAKPLASPSGEISDRKITPPVFAPTGDGKVTCDLWVLTGWSIAGEPMYAHKRLTFDPAGVPTGLPSGLR